MFVDLKASKIINYGNNTWIIFNTFRNITEYQYTTNVYLQYGVIKIQFTYEVGSTKYFVLYL